MRLIYLLLQVGELLQYLIVGLAINAQACKQCVTTRINGLGSGPGFSFGAGLGLGFSGRLLLSRGLLALAGAFFAAALGAALVLASAMTFFLAEVC